MSSVECQVSSVECRVPICVDLCCVDFVSRSFIHLSIHSFIRADINRERDILNERRIL